MKPLELGIVSDEIAPDFREAVRHALGWGIRKFEIRVLKSGRVPAVEEAELADVVATIRAHQVQVTALSPGIFKHSLAKTAALEDEIQRTLPATIALARRLGSSMIIIFGFQREPGEPASRYQDAVAWMKRAAEVAQKEGMTLAIENEPGFWADTGVNTRRLIRDVGSPALGANWDPCNAFGTTERPYPEGYEAIKDVMVNVHVKDTKKGSLIQCVPVGDGVIDWKGQVRALMRDAVVSHMTIETHCLPLVECSRKNIEVLRRYMEEDA
jgi:sugar phosphate isomerase/epimerase